MEGMKNHNYYECARMPQACTVPRMKRAVPFLLTIATVAACLAAEPDALELVRPGDAVVAVRSQLGDPAMEFPYRGLRFLDYGYCIITSSNGVVIKVKERALPETAQAQQEPSGTVNVKALIAMAQQDHAEAQNYLGYCYQVGKAVDVNMDESIRWYTLAAMQGYVDAQHNLGVIYMRGLGVEKDLMEAYTWAWLAAENGNDTLKKVLRPIITGEQEQAARLRAGRIREGLEHSPYMPYSETSKPTALAETDSKPDPVSAE